jgi:hypothetical protein
MDMKTIIASVLAAGALAAAGAASAQASIDDRVDRIETRIDHGVDDGTLTSVQADRLRAQLSAVRQRRDYLDNAGQLDTWRQDDLNGRLDRIAYDGSFRGYRQDWEGNGDDEDGGGD